MQHTKVSLTVIYLLFPTLFAFHALAKPLAAPRLHINFDDGWRFHFGNAADPSKDFGFGVANVFAKSGVGDKTPISPEFNDSTWRSLNLPHDWAVELPFEKSDNDYVISHGFKPVGGLYPETSIGWYRKAFMLSPADSGSRYSIQFDGIFRDAMIWINGFYLGNNQSGYSGVTYDITDFVNYKTPNYIVVRVDATEYEGWFYEGAGIYRHVWLNKYNNFHVTEGGVFVSSKGNTTNTIINVQTDLINENFKETAGSVTTYILERNGKQIASASSPVAPVPSNGHQVFIQEIILKSPHLWNLEDPYLYKIMTVVSAAGREMDRVQQRFGIRTIEINAKRGLLVNGHHVKVKGVCCHQDHAGVGSALPDYLQYYRIRLLKESGANAYRTSHNPPTPELLDACDSLGMLVLDENRLLSSSPEYQDQFRRLILRDRNHPSVFMWSIGNEEWKVQQRSVGKRIALSLLAEQEQLDPTRTSTYAADLPNVFNGIDEVIPVRGFNYRQYAASDYHRDHPDQPLMGTEMGSTVTTRGIYQADTIRGYVPDEDVTAPPWASTAETWWPLAAENDWWIGGFVWTGFDYRGEPTPYEWPDVNSNFGIMDMCGFPKNIYYYYQSWWSDQDVLHISPHWNWKGKEGQPINVYVNSNAQQVELFLNGKSLGKKTMKPNSHLEWSVPYAPGSLEAVGTRGNREIKAKVETTGAPIRIVLTADRRTLTADGKDATVVNVSVVDEKGREVPDAGNKIDFALKGPGDIIGTGNGDPSCHEPDKHIDDSYWRSLFNGKCQVILRSGKSAGHIEMEASGDGLQKAIVTIDVTEFSSKELARDGS